MNPEMAKALREPFKAHEIDKLPKGGRMLDYVGHARVTDRLLQVDPEWTLEPLAVNQNGSPMFEGDDLNRPVGLWVKLTVGGVSRIGYGTTEYYSDKRDPDAIKKILSDALRNAAMRFGVGLDLWTKDAVDDYVAPPPGTARGDNGHVVKPSAVAQSTVSPAGTLPASPAGQIPGAQRAAGWPLGQSIGVHETGFNKDTGEEYDCGGQFIIRRSKAGNLYAQCNGRNVGGLNYCNAFPPYGSVDAWQAVQAAGDVDPASVPDLPVANVSVPRAVVENDHHAEFIKTALETDFETGREWITAFDNDRLIALTEHIVAANKVPATLVKKVHYGDRKDMSREQLLALADALFVAHHEAIVELEEIPF